METRTKVTEIGNRNKGLGECHSQHPRCYPRLYEVHPIRNPSICQQRLFSNLLAQPTVLRAHPGAHPSVDFPLVNTHTPMQGRGAPSCMPPALDLRHPIPTVSSPATTPALTRTPSLRNNGLDEGPSSTPSVTPSTPFPWACA